MTVSAKPFPARASLWRGNIEGWAVSPPRLMPRAIPSVAPGAGCRALPERPLALEWHAAIRPGEWATRDIPV
jgi:hypothetical protein